MYTKWCVKIAVLLISFSLISLAPANEGEINSLSKTVAEQQFNIMTLKADKIVLQGKLEASKEITGYYKDSIFWRNVIESLILVAVIVG